MSVCMQSQDLHSIIITQPTQAWPLTSSLRYVGNCLMGLDAETTDRSSRAGETERRGVPQRPRGGLQPRARSESL